LFASYRALILLATRFTAEDAKDAEDQFAGNILQFEHQV
jgi:hypothetical protein